MYKSFLKLGLNLTQKWYFEAFHQHVVEPLYTTGNSNRLSSYKQHVKQMS